MNSGIRAAVALAFAAAVLSLPGTAAAAPPANDAFASATSIASLPFSDSVNVSEATTEPGEPSGGCYFPGKTVWYQFQPASDLVMRGSTAGSSFFSTVLNVYRSTGSGIGNLTFVGCSYPWSQTTVGLSAGETYYIQAGAASWELGGVLNLSLEEIPPPANDDFADARPVGSVPFSHTVDTTAAGLELGEPTPSCGYGQSAGTVWYAFTPSASGSYSAWVPYSGFWSQIAAYSGDALGNLTQIGCRTFGSLLTFRAEEGQTYYLQVGGIFGGRGNLTLMLDVAPAPIAQFWYWPGDPSMFDTISFNSNSYDPGGNPIVEQLFEFGDGASATGCCVQHHYAADGDYAVRLTVTTSDGRVASMEQIIQVRTHDVAITRISVPQSASAGQTRSVTVGISNQRYPENVRVDLYRSSATGFELVGSLTQSVPVRRGGRTTDFSINYTFTSDDAALGSVNFKAVATIVGYRDAVITNNEAVALPTRVR